MFRWLADAVLVVHFAVVVFVVGGLVAIVLGNWRRWSWVNALGFRVAHLAAILFVAAEAWIGIACPLTTAEMWLRRIAAAPTYAGGFVAHWLGRLLYYDAPEWVFVFGYSLFALIVLGAWAKYPPRRRRSGGTKG